MKATDAKVTVFGFICATIVLMWIAWCTVQCGGPDAQAAAETRAYNQGKVDQKMEVLGVKP